MAHLTYEQCQYMPDLLSSRSPRETWETFLKCTERQTPGRIRTEALATD